MNDLLNFKKRRSTLRWGSNEIAESEILKIVKVKQYKKKVLKALNILEDSEELPKGQNKRNVY